MNTKKTAITIVAAMMVLAMITTAAMACFEPCGTKIEQCTGNNATKDAVYALILPGVTGVGTPAAVPAMAFAYVDIATPNGRFDFGECAYIDTNWNNGASAPVVQTGDVRITDCCNCPNNTVVGVCTCTGYTELGKPLTYPNQDIVGYVNINLNGVYDLGDPLYLDVGGIGTNPVGRVSPNDIRLTGRNDTTPAYPVYSVVRIGDADISVVPNLFDPVTNLFITPALNDGTLLNNMLGFVDSWCDGAWDTNGRDKLYLQQLVLAPIHALNQFDAFVTIGDFRLYMPTNESCWPDCGTKVHQCDVDAEYGLLRPGQDAPINGVVLPGTRFRYVDINPNPGFDVGDHAYIDMNGAVGPAVVQRGDVRVTNACPPCGPNTLVGVCSDCDLSPPAGFAAITKQDIVGYVDVNANGVYDLGDPLYLDIGGLSAAVFAPVGDGMVSVGDIRLTDRTDTMPPYDNYTVVGIGDKDISVVANLRDPVTNALLSPIVNDDTVLNLLLGFVDSNCDSRWDVVHGNDKLYLQQIVITLGGAGNQFDVFPTIGDFRLYMPLDEPCWPDCGTKVHQCDVDAVYGLMIPGVTPATPNGAAISAMQFGFTDKNGDGVFDITNDECAYIDTNIVADGTSSTGFRVARGDVRLCDCCLDFNNTVVEACDTDEIGQELTIPVVPLGPNAGTQMALVGYVDVNADPILPGYDVGEPLYLDCGGPLPLYADGVVSAGDIRLTGRGIYPPYSVVKSGDADETAANKLLYDPRTDIPTIDVLTIFAATPTFNQYLGFIDSECDGVWDIDGEDKLYLQQLVPAPDPASVLPYWVSAQFNWMSTIGDFRIYMPLGSPIVTPTVPMEGDVHVTGAEEDHVNINDVLRIQLYLANPAGNPLTADQLTSAEAWEEGASAGVIDINDVLAIQKWLADPTFGLWKTAYDSGVTEQPAP